MKTYVAQCPWSSRFRGLDPGTPEFSRVWKEIASQERDAFGADQHAYVKTVYFDRSADNALRDLNLDVSGRSHTLQDVLWSTAVHHGRDNSIFKRALARRGDVASLADREIIEAVYSERGRTMADGSLYYFRSSSKDVQRGVAARFRSELRDALRMLAEEEAATAATPAATPVAVAMSPAHPQTLGGTVTSSSGAPVPAGGGSNASGSTRAGGGRSRPRSGRKRPGS